MKLRRLAISLGMLGGLIGGAWLAAPSAVRWYIESEYPGVTVGAVELTLDSAKLSKVHVVRPYGVADIDQVVVHRDGSVEAEGGNATVRLDLLPEGKSGNPAGGRKITAKGIQVEVKLETSHATFEGVSYEGGKVCWDTVGGAVGKLRGYDPCTVLACFSNGMGLVEAESGCATRDKIEVSHAETEVQLKHNLPHIPSFGTIALEGVTFDPRHLSVDIAKVSYGPVQASGVTVERGGTVTQLVLRKLVLNHPWLSTGPLTLDEGVTIEKRDHESLITANIGLVPIQVDLETLTVSSVARCREWASSMPVELQEPLVGIEWDEGTLAVDLDIRAPRVKLKHSCKAKCKTPLLAALRKPFKYLAYHPDDTRFERETGPGTKDWTYLPDVGKDVPTAVIAMEDPGFPSHRGYIGQAFENSLKDNLATGKFLRGGSTITMQLAKNLWLYRDKTIPRKLQEVLLAIALEDCYSKSDILELYLNVVEFGPDLYGIGPASRRYFKVSPTEVTAEQAFSLAMLLPRPRRGLPDKARVRKLMETMARLKVIPESMLESEEPVDFSEWQ